MMKNIAKTLLILIALPGMLHAQSTPPAKLDLYILIGQSNMAGRGPITPEIALEHDDHVYMFTKDKLWVPAKHPVHFDKPSVAGVGPGLTFGIVMAKNSAGANIGLIPCAVGGTPISAWEPGAYDKPTKTHPYDDAVERTKAAMAYGNIKGAIWLQGESDSSPEKAKVWLDKLKVLIQRVRELTGQPNLPVVAGELGRYRQNYALINTELHLLPAQVANTAIASSEGLVHKGDTTHFDGPSAQEMGRRMAAKMIELQKK